MLSGHRIARLAFSVARWIVSTSISGHFPEGLPCARETIQLLQKIFSCVPAEDGVFQNRSRPLFAATRSSAVPGRASI